MAELHMVRMQLGQADLHANGGAGRGVFDLDYAVHSQLRKVFGEGAPHPFRILEDRDRDVLVLGYGPNSALELEKDSLSIAWTELSSKPMPALHLAHRLKFEVRFCPVVRKASDGPKHRKGAEVDAFLSECWKNPEERVDRHHVYREWLSTRFSNGGATVIDSQITRFLRQRVFRRTQGEHRKGRSFERPDVIASGMIQVTDPIAFRELLSRGLGRHRAFGFGMILLRAA